MKYLKKFLGPILILGCMLLRGTDVVFRATTLQFFNPLELITLEHTIGFLVILPFFPKVGKIKDLRVSEFFSLIFIGFGSSVGGILCFTAAFNFLPPPVVILLQKLQPVVSISLAMIILKDRVAPAFYFWSLIAISAGFVMTFGFSLPEISLASRDLVGFGLALLAVFFWGAGTVFGKFLIKSLDSTSITKWRYIFGFIFALALLLSTGSVNELHIFNEPRYLLNITYMALVPGFLALFLFYRGLKTTSAPVASILELFFPISAVVFSWIFLGKALSLLQMGSAAILLFSILMISRLNR